MGGQRQQVACILEKDSAIWASLRATRRCADGYWVRPGSLKWPVPDPSGFGIRRSSSASGMP